MAKLAWYNVGGLDSIEYICGYCGRSVASAQGYYTGNAHGFFICICPNCSQPTYISPNKHVPGVAPGAEVSHLPKDIDALYREARNCIAASCNTAAVLVARKLLMNIAVAQGA